MITLAERLRRYPTKPIAVVPVLLLTFVIAGGCGGGGDTPTDPDDRPAYAQLNIQASGASPVDSVLVIEITAPDISPPLTFNFQIVNGSVSGSITVKAGSNRKITARTYDADGIETRRGETTITVREGSNPTLTMTLMPLEGDVPIDIILGAFTLSVIPEADTLVVGDTLRLAAVVVDALGDTLSVSVSWGSMDPSVAQVDTAGLVTAIAAGVAQVGATYAGAGDAATMTVTGS